MVNYLPAPLSAPPISQRHPFHLAHVVENPSSEKTRPVPNSNIPLHNNSSPSFSRLAEPSAFITTPSDIQITRPDLPVKRPVIVMPKDTISDPSSLDVNNNEEQKPSFGSMNTPVNHIHASASPVTPCEAVTPMNGTIEDPPPVTVVATPPIESLKRPSLVINVEELPTPKKPRLEEQKNVGDSAKSAGDTGELSLASAEEDPEESEDEEIQVGPDGLRPVEDCLPDLIEDDEENAEMKLCKLCM
ncbi:hypothetical protein C0992_000804 [Termitomyces sp. T32_za158]|nr:hypothetical protein C0992_000804 [Termitomyces sp. T32_za158]